MARPPYAVSVRSGPRVERERFEDLPAALEFIERRGRELEEEVDLRTVDLKLVRRIEPVQQVVARLEVAGPGRLRAGVDVRGDGSSEGYTGRIRRRVIEQRRRESAYDALRRAITA